MKFITILLLGSIILNAGFLDSFTKDLGVEKVIDKIGDGIDEVAKEVGVGEVINEIGASLGTVEMKKKEEWFNPPPPIKNYNKDKQHYCTTDIKVASINYLRHPSFGNYIPGPFDTVDGLFDESLLDDSRLIISHEFDHNKYKETMDIFFKALNKVDYDGGNFGIEKVAIFIERKSTTKNQKLSPLNVKVQFVDRQLNPLSEELSYNKLDWGISIDTNDINKYSQNEKDGVSYVKVTYQLDGINKDFFHIYKINTLIFKKSVLLERVSLVGENFRNIHPDDKKSIKVYISELTNTSPYSFQSNSGLYRSKNTNINTFLNWNPNAILYKDLKLKNYVLNSKEQTYIYEKGYLTPMLSGIVKLKKDEKKIKKSIFNAFGVENKMGSTFISRWNDMVNSYGFQNGGLITFETKDKQKITLNPRKLYEKSKTTTGKSIENKILAIHSPVSALFLEATNDEKEKNTTTYSQSLAQNIYKTEEFINSLGSLGHNRDNTIDPFTYMYMSFNEYAAIWGLTAEEARRLFYVDKNNRIVWRLANLRDYFAKNHVSEFVDIDSKNSFSIKALNVKSKPFNGNTLDQLTADNLTQNQFDNLADNENNLFLIKLLRQTETFDEMPNGKSFERVIIENNCLSVNLKYKNSYECRETLAWKPKAEIEDINGKLTKTAEKITYIYSKPFKFLSKEERKKIKQQQLLKEKEKEKLALVDKKKNINSFYTTNLSLISKAIKNGQNINELGGLGLTRLDYFLNNMIDPVSGKKYSEALFLFLIKNGATLSCDKTPESINYEDLGYSVNLHSTKKSLSELHHDIKNYIKNNKVSMPLVTFMAPIEDKIKYEKYEKSIKGFFDFHNIFDRICQGESKNKILNELFEKEKIKFLSGEKNYLRDFYIYKIVDTDVNMQFSPQKYNIPSQTSILTHSVAVKDMDLFNYLIDNGADVNLRASTIIYAGANGLDDYLLKLIKHGVNVNAESSNGLTALFLAAENGYYLTVKILIENDANVNHIHHETGDSILIAAVLNEKWDIVKLLVENGADTNYKGNKGLNAINILNKKFNKLWSDTSEYNPVIQLKPFYKYNLIKIKDINVIYEGQLNNILHLASTHDDLVFIKDLLEKGANPNLVNNDTVAWNSLHFASLYSTPEVILALLKNGADVNSISSKEHNIGASPLILAVSEGKIANTKILLDNGANIMYKAIDGTTALDYAQTSEMKDLLLKYYKK